MQGTHDPYAALRHRDYRFLWAASVLASIGTEAQATVVGWELYARTGSASYLGYAGLAQFLPVVLLSLPAGHAADHFSRRGLFQTAQWLMVLASLGLAALSLLQGPVSLIFLCLVLTGCSRAVSAPARSSLVPQIVPPEVLSNAITWNSSGWQIANVAGPALGGFGIALAGDRAGPAYVLAAICSLCCVGLVAFIRPRAIAAEGISPTWQALLAGVRFVGRTKLLLAAITLDLFAVLLGGATALLPIFARDILDVGPEGLGWLRAAPAVGAGLMAMTLAHARPLKRAGHALLLAVAGFGVATIVFGLSRHFLLSFIMLALTGALDNISVVIRHTLVHIITPDSMRGRVSAVNLIFISSSNELGAFESGLTAEWFGAVASVVGGGFGTILVVVAVMLRWPQILHLGPLHRMIPLPAKQPAAVAREEALLSVREEGPAS
jgi:MFS family permease